MNFMKTLTSMPFVELHAKRTQISLLFTHYTQQLDAINPTVFAFSTTEQLNTYEEQLRFIFCTVYAQFKIDRAEGRQHLSGDHIDKLKACVQLLKKLHAARGKEGPQAEFNQEAALSDKPLKFLGLRILAPWLKDRIEEVVNNKISSKRKSSKETDSNGNEEDQTTIKKTEVLKGWLSAINAKRLYWIWGSALLGSILARLPNDFYHKQAVQHNLSAASPVTGYVSWLLYYTRFGINLSLLLKHTISGPWMSGTEKTVSSGERFKTQWDQRKFDLINDSMWATVNLISFFWLIGSGATGYAGNVLAVNLMLVDLVLVGWKFSEEKANHNKTIESIRKTIENFQQKKAKVVEKLVKMEQDSSLVVDKSAIIEELKQKIKEVEVKIAEASMRERESKVSENAIIYFKAKKDKLIKKLRVMEKDPSQFIEKAPIISELKQKIAKFDLEIKHQNQMKNQIEIDWKFKCRNLAVNLTYAIGFLTGFAFICCFFFPPAAIVPATAMMLGLVGAALCFVLTVVSASITAGMELDKAKKPRQLIQKERQEFLNQFEKTSKQLENTTDKLEQARLSTEQKMLFLEIKRLDRDTEYHQKFVDLQVKKLVRALFIDTLLPAVSLIAVVFMPLTIGIGITVSGFALAILTWWPLKDDPKAAALKELTEDELAAELDNFKNERRQEKRKAESVQLQDKKGAKPTTKQHLRLFTNGYVTDDGTSPKNETSPITLDKVPGNPHS